mmetsp:Transcript_13398/g.31451  ORF Transcript_13398/g.31451 Transcript_13398/m.31451 type:complete len:207 (+) Transcript_13398:261-881(+)
MLGGGRCAIEEKSRQQPFAKDEQSRPWGNAGIGEETRSSSSPGPQQELRVCLGTVEGTQNGSRRQPGRRRDPATQGDKSIEQRAERRKGGILLATLESQRHLSRCSPPGASHVWGALPLSQSLSLLRGGRGGMRQEARAILWPRRGRDAWHPQEGQRELCVCPKTGEGRHRTVLKRPRGLKRSAAMRGDGSVEHPRGQQKGGSFLK